jgi:hypothetical protein
MDHVCFQAVELELANRVVDVEDAVTELNRTTAGVGAA